MHNDLFEKMNPIIPCALVDKSLNIKTANAVFWDLLGDNAYRSVYSLLNEQDVQLLKQEVDSLFGKSDLKMFLEMYNGVEKRKVLLVFQYYDDDSIFLKILDADIMFAIGDEYSYERDRFQTLLRLENDMYFDYNSTTEKIMVYFLNSSERVVRYNQNIDEWYTQILENKQIEEKDIDTFKDFCNDLKNCRSEFRYQINSNMLVSSSIGYEFIHISGTTIIDIKGTNHVIGVLSVYNEQTDTKIDTILDDFFNDPLTNVLNKKEIQEYGKRVVKSHPDKNIAIIIVDVDYFKSVNDNYGHMFGDDVLKSVANILQKSVGKRGVTGRIGGDEFFIVLDNYGNEVELRNVLRSIRNSFAWLFPDKLGIINFGCSIGVSQYPKDAMTFDELFKIADDALYIAKAKGKNRYIIFDIEKHGAFSGLEMENNTGINNLINPLKSTALIMNDIGSVIANSLLKEDKDYDLLLKGLVKNTNVDRAALYGGEALGVIATYPYEYRDECTCEYMDSKEFVDSHDNMGRVMVNNVNEFEYKNPAVYKILKKTGTESIFQYLIKNDNDDIVGILVIETTKNIITWSTIQVNVYTMVGSILKEVFAKISKDEMVF